MKRTRYWYAVSNTHVFCFTKKASRDQFCKGNDLWKPCPAVQVLKHIQGNTTFSISRVK